MEIYPVQEIDKKTKKLKTSFDIGALSSNLHIMNENVRDKSPILNNRTNAKLAISWPKIIGPNSDIAYEKKKCTKNKTRNQKSKKKKLQINLLFHLIFLTQVIVALVDLTLENSQLCFIHFQKTKSLQKIRHLRRHL